MIKPRIWGKYEQCVSQIVKQITFLQDKLEEMLIPRYEIEGGKKPHIVKYMISKRLKNIVQYRHSLFERVYPISEKLAIKMLNAGYKQPSRFGRWCPVKVLFLCS